MGILRDMGNVNNGAVEPTLQRQLWAAAERDEGAGGRQHQAKSTVRKCLAELEIKKKIKNNLVRVFFICCKAILPLPRVTSKLSLNTVK